MTFQDRGLVIISSLITEENNDKPYIFLHILYMYAYLYTFNIYC